jgi:hypothetical protein
MAMGKNQTMAFKSVKRNGKGFSPLLFFKSLVRKSLPIFALFILLFLFFIKSNVVYAAANPDFNLTFYRGQKEIEFGAVDAEKIDWSISLQTGLMDSVAFDVYDCKGNKIHSGTNGSIRMDKNYFPIKFVARTNSTSDWRVTISITKTGGGGSQKDYSGILGKISDKLSGILDKLSGISDLLDSIFKKLKDIDDFLSNPKHLQKGMDDLKNSYENLENYSPVSSSVVSGIGSLGSGGSGGGGLSFNVEIIPGYTINALDLSQLSGLISTIRKLMTAILWIELAMFFIRIFVPKLKV